MQRVRKFAAPSYRVTAKLLLPTLALLAYGRQVALVDLSLRKGPPYPPMVISGRGGRVYDGPQKPSESPPIRLVITKFSAKRIATLLQYVAEVVITNVGKAPISIPIGVSTDSILAPTQHDRNSLSFSATFAKSGRALMQSGGESASNSEHPESSAVLEPGDTAVFIVPVGMWPADKIPTDEIAFQVQRWRKIAEGAEDWAEPVGSQIRSENSLPLPPPPGQ